MMTATELNKGSIARREFYCTYWLAKVLLRPKGCAVVWSLFLKCVADFKGCLQLWEGLGPVTKDFRDAGRTAKEIPGFCSDLGCVLKLRISQSGPVDEYLCGVTVPIKYIYIVSIHSGSMS